MYTLTQRAPLAPQAPARAARPGPAIDADERPLHSEALLQGRKAVTISHNGTIYRLQATRLGKLILTK